MLSGILIVCVVVCIRRLLRFPFALVRSWKALLWYNKLSWKSIYRRTHWCRAAFHSVARWISFFFKGMCVSSAWRRLTRSRGRVAVPPGVRWRHVASGVPRVCSTRFTDTRHQPARLSCQQGRNTTAPLSFGFTGPVNCNDVVLVVVRVSRWEQTTLTATQASCPLWRCCCHGQVLWVSPLLLCRYYTVQSQLCNLFSLLQSIDVIFTNWDCVKLFLLGQRKLLLYPVTCALSRSELRPGAPGLLLQEQRRRL